MMGRKGEMRWREERRGEGEDGERRLETDYIAVHGGPHLLCTTGGGEGRIVCSSTAWATQ